eukprot:2200835-Lingulodinium_polyedra.AAC.1
MEAGVSAFQGKRMSRSLSTPLTSRARARLDGMAAAQTQKSLKFLSMVDTISYMDSRRSTSRRLLFNW